MSFKVILHQFWVKKIFPENSIWNTAVPLLSYSCMFQVEICSQQLEICKSCACLSSTPLLWRLINFRLFCFDDCRSWPCEERFWSDDCRSWPREEKINNHGCWGKHVHIPDNDYWGICLFHVVWTNFFCNYSYVVHTEYIFFSSTEHCAWAIISPKEFKSWVTRISFALLYGKTELSAVKYFAICSSNLLLSGFLMLCSWF
jgi:hypothetical protein